MEKFVGIVWSKSVIKITETKKSAVVTVATASRPNLFSF